MVTVGNYLKGDRNCVLQTNQVGSKASSSCRGTITPRTRRSKRLDGGGRSSTFLRIPPTNEPGAPSAYGFRRACWPPSKPFHSGRSRESDREHTLPIGQGSLEQRQS